MAGVAGTPAATRRRGWRSKPALRQSTQIEWVGVRDDGGGRPSADREAVIRSAISRWRVGLIDIAAANRLLTLQPGGAAMIEVAPPAAGGGPPPPRTSGAFPVSPPPPPGPAAAPTRGAAPRRPPAAHPPVTPVVHE